MRDLRLRRRGPFEHRVTRTGVAGTGHPGQERPPGRTHNRHWLAERGVLAVNLMSSPGAGKTTLLERTIRDLAGRVGVGHRGRPGDRSSTPTASAPPAAPAVQINTGAGLPPRRGDGRARPARHSTRRAGSIVVIENVGNLVCPALFDLGEAARVVMTSVTEGADKPLKYPHMFRSARPGPAQQDRPAARTSTSTSARSATTRPGQPARRDASTCPPPPASACPPGTTGWPARSPAARCRSAPGRWSSSGPGSSGRRPRPPPPRPGPG